MDYLRRDQAQPGFWQTYVSHPKSILILILVCAVIGTMTHLFNGISWFVNLGFSLCFGFPISMIESFLRTRKKKLPESVLNILSVVLGCFVGTAAVYAYLVFKGYVEPGYMGSLFYVNFGIAFIFSGVAFYFFWSRYRNQTLTLALRDQQLKAAELENLKQQAENRLLQAQMEPHFLFNTLANIQSLVDIEPKLAKKLIGDLSNMLRASLNYSTRDSCTVRDELEFVRAYLNIQTVRLGDRLIVEESISESALNALMLPMLIQPLVENAIKHGVEKSMSPVMLHLQVIEEQEQLVIRIRDDHEGDPSTDGGFGITLNNIRQRLSNRYGASAKVISQAEATGWLSEVRLPIERESS